MNEDEEIDIHKEELKRLYGMILEAAKLHTRLQSLPRNKYDKRDNRRKQLTMIKMHSGCRVERRVKEFEVYKKLTQD